MSGISPLTSIARSSAVAPPSGVTPSSTLLTGTAGAGSNSFGSALTGAVDNLQQVQNKADGLAMQAVTGSLANPHDYMIAATEASLNTQMTVAVRNKALEAFNEIMRMPL
jgi:flagellar hook-basal body complex protein FliE